MTRRSVPSWAAGIVAVAVLGAGGTDAVQRPGHPAAVKHRPHKPSKRVAARPAPRVDALRPVPYAELFRRAGRRHGISPVLLAAVAKTESDFRPRLVSSAGARGLMQIMPAVAAERGIDPFNPSQAVDAAARILAASLRRYHGSVRLALYAYNGGPGRARDYTRGRAIPTETRNYYPKVMRNMRELKV